MTRIHGERVAALVPAYGPVHVLLVGEAPGPRGADKSGVPFFGDAAGLHLYRVLERVGAVVMPDVTRSLPWDGAQFAAAGLRPTAFGVALGNAFDQCPTDDGVRFRAPTRTELEGDANVERLVHEFTQLSARGLRGIVTMGRVATKTVDVVLRRAPMPTLVRFAVPHPSAQGLLSMAPDRGKGAKMQDLQEAWMAQCEAKIVNAGFSRASQACDPHTATV
jgi:hypothetical protein